MNGSINVFCGIFKYVVASAEEAEMGYMLLNAKEGNIMIILPQTLVHKQHTNANPL